jgi:hypothetical protein
MDAVILRFPYGTEFQWTTAVPAVGQVVTRGSTEWIVASRDAGDLPSFVLKPHGDARTGSGSVVSAPTRMPAFSAAASGSGVSR